MEDRFLIGYARVSTEDQELRLQIDALKKYGVPESKIITEKKSGKKLRNRKLYQLITEFLREGDRIVVWKLDRLGRSVKELVEIVELIEKSGADFISLTEGINTSTAAGRMYFHMFAAIAEFERGLISERTKAGMLAKKLADPDYRAGAKNKIADVPARIEQVQEFYDSGEIVLLAKYKQRGPKKGERSGYTVRRGVLGPLMDALNECVKDEKPITNTLTISRWMEDGCRGLKLREEDEKHEDGA